MAAGAAALGLLLACGRRQPVAVTERYTLPLPTYFPAPQLPADNPLSAAKVALGRRLFYDRRLSKNGTQSCATSHIPALAFTDGLPRAVGSTGEEGPRNTPSLANVAYNATFTWANNLLLSLEAQAMVPLFNMHPVELGVTDTPALLLALAADPSYPPAFAQAFGGAGQPTLQQVVQALAAFERRILSANAPFDRFVYGGLEDALSAAQKRGLALFFSDRLECTHCHGGFNLTDSVRRAPTSAAAWRRLHNPPPPVAMPLHNTALYNLDGRGAYPPGDPGLLAVTQLAGDMGRFKAPSLRNVAITAPYFHDGSAPSLDDVIDHYAAGGRTLAAGPNAGVGSSSPLRDVLLQGFVISAAERDDLKAFLTSLTDNAFLHDPELADPAGG